MNDDSKFGSENISAPVLDDIEYSAPSEKKNGPQGVSAPVLDDMDYVAPASKKDGPQGVTAPILDDFDDYTPNSHKKGVPENVSAPILDDDNYTASKAEMTEDDMIIAGLSEEQKAMYDRLPPDKQRQVLDMRKAQLAHQNASESVPQETAAPIKPPVLDDEDNYTPPTKEEKKPVEPIKAPILDDEPEPVKYVPKFADEDLERAKKEGAKRSVSSQLTSNQKDEKESLRMMLELKAEREAEATKKGFKIVIVIALVGIISAVLFFMLYSGKFLDLAYADINASKLTKILSSGSGYVAGIAGLASLLLITGAGGLKSLCSFIYLVFDILQLILIFTVAPQITGGAAAKWGLLAGALICSIVVFIMLSTSEPVSQFYKKPTKDYNH